MSEPGVLEAIHSARALRRFKPDPIADEVITKLLDAAIRAPSGSNAQNWIFVVVRDAVVKQRLGEIYQRASRVLLAEYGERVRPDHLEERQFELMRKSAGYLFEHLAEAPALIVLGLMLTAKGSRFSPLAHEQEAARHWRTSGASIYPAVQNIILTCRALGLGTVLTTIHTYFEDEVKEVLELPADAHTYAVMPIGYPRDKFGPVRRRPLAEVAFLDRWGNSWRG